MRDLWNTIRQQMTALNLLMYVIVTGGYCLVEYINRNAGAERKATGLERDLRSLKSNSHSSAMALPPYIVSNGVKKIILALEDILYFRASGPYIKIVTRDHVYLDKKTLSSLEKKTLPASFIPVHRSSIVNVACIKEVRSTLNGDYTVSLNNGHVIRASRTYRQRLFSCLGNETTVHDRKSSSRAS